MGTAIKQIVMGLALLAGPVFGQLNFPGGRIAVSHDGNNYDKDDYVAAAMNLALLEAGGLKSELVHFDHSCHLVNKPKQYAAMLESVNGGAARFNVDPSKIFDVQAQLDEAVANFKAEAEKSSADDPLWFIICGPMEVPYRCIEAVDPEYRKFIHCISHSGWNNGHTEPPSMTRRKPDVVKLGVVFHDIKNQNKTGWNTPKENVQWMAASGNPDLRWLYERNVKGTYDTSDSGMLWWLMTGGPNGGDENGGWADYKPLLESLSAGGKIEEGFKTIFNGENWDGWYLKIRSGDEELAKKVYAIEDGVIHVFNDEFPEEYNLNTGANDTHGLFYTEKTYTNYVLRFEYKWGTKKANNFGKWQYDAGVYYHVTDDRIWPVGIEYQIRYNHETGRNHTGDLIRPGGADYDWFEGEDGAYLHPDDGGVPEKKKSWLHLCKETDNHHALDGGWNECEIIVMGDQYAIHKLNGEVVNMCFNLKPSAGIFGFQSETAEIFYRNIRVKEYDAPVPAEQFLK